jgi:hypothetical protein
MARSLPRDRCVSRADPAAAGKHHSMQCQLILFTYWLSIQPQYKKILLLRWQLYRELKSTARDFGTPENYINHKIKLGLGHFIQWVEWKGSEYDVFRMDREVGGKNPRIDSKSYQCPCHTSYGCSFGLQAVQSVYPT